MSCPFFRIEMLPAKQGDALLIEYGDETMTRRILIDGGPIEAYQALTGRLNGLDEGERGVALVVITHVDTDHIDGIIRMFAEKPINWAISPNDIWFNGLRHMKNETLGGLEGDYLSALIRRRAFDKWNKAFNRQAVVVDPDMPQPVEKPLDDGFSDGMKLTVLSPIPENLKNMAQVWETSVVKPGDLDAAWEKLVKDTKFRPEDGFLGGPPDFQKKLMKQLKPKTSEANASSIAFLAKFRDKKCLFLGDAHAPVLCESIKKLIPAGEKRLKVDAVKMSHHGSRYNISKRLIDMIDAKYFLISTDGTGSRNGHPDKAAIDAVIEWSPSEPELWFNYETKYTYCWKSGPAPGSKPFVAHYPEPGKEGIVVEL